MPVRAECGQTRRRGRGGLVDAAELGTVRREGLPALSDEERTGTVGGDDTEMAESVRDEPDKAAAASGWRR